MSNIHQLRQLRANAISCWRAMTQRKIAQQLLKDGDRTKAAEAKQLFDAADLGLSAMGRPEAQQIGEQMRKRGPILPTV